MLRAERCWLSRILRLFTLSRPKSNENTRRRRGHLARHHKKFKTFPRQNSILCNWGFPEFNCSYLIIRQNVYNFLMSSFFCQLRRGLSINGEQGGISAEFHKQEPVKTSHVHLKLFRLLNCCQNLAHRLIFQKGGGRKKYPGKGGLHLK